MFRCFWLAWIVSVTLSHAATTSTDTVLSAIKSDDIAALRQMLETNRKLVNALGERGMTPLHFAALYGTTQSLQVLLNAGADVNSRSTANATPLILAAYSPEKTKLLLAAGSDAKAKTSAGRTALHVAAGRAGATEVVKALLHAGAAIEEADKQESTPLLLALQYSDTATVRALLDGGAKINNIGKANFTPVMAAVRSHDVERVRLLIDLGADVNGALLFAGASKHGPIALTNMTPLIAASALGSHDMVALLLKAGATVNTQDARGMTPLMTAVATDNMSEKTVALLLAAGADANAKDLTGSTVLDWAMRIQNPSILRRLKAAGAKQGKNSDDAQTAVPVNALAHVPPAQSFAMGFDLLTKSSKQFFQQSGCSGCHHQSVASQVYAAARSANLSVNNDIVDVQNASLKALLPYDADMWQFIEPGGDMESVGRVGLSFAAVNLPRNAFMEAAAHYAAGRQNLDGSWAMFGLARAPDADSDIARTALGVQLLQKFGWPARQAEFNERIARARQWLLQANPRTTLESAQLLLALNVAGASKASLKPYVARVLREQRADGGWGQNRFLPSDAYATGVALRALYETGLPSASSRYQRGVAYLRSTQLSDGSWYVRSRAPKFQPYFESGFPHGHDQWLSSLATGQALTALAYAIGDDNASKQVLSAAKRNTN